MTKKTHTLKLSEKELAGLLFLLNMANGRSTFRIWKQCKDILLKFIDVDDFDDKHKSLCDECVDDCHIDYYSVEKEWEDYLGISGENKVIKEKLQEIERLQKEIERLQKEVDQMQGE